MARIKTINDFKKARDEKNPIAMITCYDFACARLIEESDIDVILVGDSVGMAFAGNSTTLPVTVEQMIYHATIVRRGAPETFIVVDLPFMSYHVSAEDTLRNCGRIMKETGANAVKLEGGRDFAHIVEVLTKASIPVMGHLGLTPQSVHKLGGYTVQGREEDKRRIMIEDAKILEDNGAFSIVLEMVPALLAGEITKSLSIPTIGIGAGNLCDGQVLVINDMLGFDERFNPKFLKKYTNLADTVRKALSDYSREVKAGTFPAAEHSFK
ncbi:MAG: 3-methyl-2-oxobutanoate hydroxymethyltransferase [Spirochaetes bacterium]|jgi:3-methyl-2-oxobutanoate hydroxymethyltransferase|nr:3-methyl-2-oxobutanoate hydroxymethyltransferase [Spirochaetota bacterium]